MRASIPFPDRHEARLRRIHVEIVAVHHELGVERIASSMHVGVQVLPALVRALWCTTDAGGAGCRRLLQPEAR